MEKRANSESEGYCALLIAILRNCTVETAIKSFETGRLKYSVDDYREMCRMKRLGNTYNQIGKIYGISKDMAFRHILKYKKLEKESGYDWDKIVRRNWDERKILK